MPREFGDRLLRHVFGAFSYVDGFWRLRGSDINDPSSPPSGLPDASKALAHLPFCRIE
jgi:hypothetical protein